MGMNRESSIVGTFIYIQLCFIAVCVGSSPCIPEAGRLGRYTVRGSGGFWAEGIPSGLEVEVSITCDAGAVAQQSVTSQCSNGVWIPAWPRCEKACSVPQSGLDVRQYVNGDPTKPIDRYYSNPSLPDGYFLIARCRDPGKKRLIGDQRRTCQGGQWTGQEPECRNVQTKVLFFGAGREVAPNGTVVVYVHQGDTRHLNVVCKIPRLSLTRPRLTTPLVNDGELEHWHWSRSHVKQLQPISTDFSGIYTCTWSPLSHTVHVLFRAAECKVPTAPEHGGYRSGHQPGETALAGTRISFRCDDDYRLVGSTTLRCSKGKWLEVPPICKVSKCPELSIPDHALMVGVYGYGRDIGDERIFHCRPGYILQGATNNLICMENGNWSAELPTCEEISVEDSPAIQVPDHHNTAIAHVDLSSSSLSSYEDYGFQNVQTEPTESNRPSQSARDDIPALDYSSFDSLYASDGPSFLSLFDDGIDETDDSPPTPSSGNRLGIDGEHHSSQRTSNESYTVIADETQQPPQPSNRSHSEIADETYQTRSGTSDTAIHQTHPPANQPRITEGSHPTPSPSNQTQPETAEDF